MLDAILDRISVIRIVKKFYSILSAQQRHRIFVLAILMVIGGFLEMLSVSLVLPFMEVVMSPEETMQKPYVRILCDLFDINSDRTFIVALAFLLALLFLLKNAYLLLEYNIQCRFVYQNELYFQSSLLSAFLHRSYEYYLGANSGEIIRIVSEDTPVAFYMFVTMLQFFSELFVSVALIGTVFIVSPAITIWIAIILITLLAIITCFIKPALRNASLSFQTSVSEMNKWLLQSIHGIKEIKVVKRESYFQRSFDKYGEQKTIADRRRDFYGVIPRFLIEAFSMSTMFIVVGIMIYKGKEIESLIPMLTAIVMAALRLLPSVNRMSACLSNISYSEPMLDNLIENLCFLRKDEGGYAIKKLQLKNSDQISSSSQINGINEKLEICGITYKYPQGDVNVLTEASFEVLSGESVGIIGASGAGKTTAVDIILGLLQPQSGRILVDGKDISDDMKGWLSQIGYIPQMIFMLDDTIRANVAFGKETIEINDEEVWQAIDESSLGEFVRSLPNGLDTRIGERGVRLSGGQRQRIGIARALYLHPSLLILDEATSALDSETEKDIIDSINHLHGKKTMIIIAHRLTTIEACDHVFKVENGKITLER